MKKIYVNGKFFSQRITGTQRYARELLNALDRLLSAECNREIEIEVLVPRGVKSIPQYSGIAARAVGRMNGIPWEQFELPKYCRDEVLFTPSGAAPILHNRNVVTIHDAAVAAAPAGYSLAYRLWYRNVCRWMGRTAQHIFTNSKFSKSDIVKWYGAAPERISVTYLGADHFRSLQADASALARLNISGKYLLAASSRNPNKNFHRVVQALDHLDKNSLQLVVAGGIDDRIYRDSAEFPDEVRSVGYVSDAELKALYENAACFVTASLYEGFGFPPLEAISSGCPVVVSRAGALPEIFQGAAIFCDPNSPQDIAAAIRRALDNPPDVEQLKTFAKTFSWEKCARETLQVLKTV